MVAAAAPPPPVPRTAEVQAEIDALLAFRAALRDPYAAMAGWDASFPSAPCSWRGVACAPGPAGRVVELQLPRLRLAGPVSPALASLRRLQKLSLRSNALSDAIPPALARLASLRTVFLQDNALSGPIPPSFHLPLLAANARTPLLLPAAASKHPHQRLSKTSGGEWMRL